MPEFEFFLHARQAADDYQKAAADLQRRYPHLTVLATVEQFCQCSHEVVPRLADRYHEVSQLYRTTLEASCRYGADDYTIDDYAIVSAGNDGAWVQCWIWVDRMDAKAADPNEKETPCAG